MINLDLADQQPTASTWSWPDSSYVPEPTRRQIEAMHTAPQQQRRDELAELRSANAALERRVAMLEAAMKRRAPTMALLDGLAQGFGQALRAEREEINEKFAAMEATRLRYAGVYVQGNEYLPGMVTTRSGSSWHCNVATTAVPGQSPDWELMTKAGRNGRDAPAARRAQPEPPE